MNRIWSLILIAICLKSYGQNSFSYDTNYVKENYDQLCVTLIGQNTDYELIVSNEKEDEKDLVYVTNAPTTYGFGLDYKWLTFSYTYAFKSMNESLYDGGFTSLRTISAGITSKRFWIRGLYQTQKGMYVSNLDEFPEKDVITSKRDDIKGSALFGTFNYLFNGKRRYSHNASLWQIDQQLKSAGAFTVGLTAAIYSTRADSSLVPSALSNTFTYSNNVTRSRTQSYVATGGYLHTFVIAKRFFIHLGLIPGVCLQKTNTSLSSGGELNSKLKLGGYTEGRIGIGYNGKKYYVGASNVSYLFTENSFDAALEHSYNYVRLFVGMRLPLKLKVPLEKYF